jgi:hypothetical protein
MTTPWATRREWRAALSHRQAQHAARTGIAVAQRIRARESAQPTTTGRWHSISLADGDTGAALMCGYLGECLSDPTWAVSAHAFLLKAATSAQGAGPNAPGLFNGLAGLGFAASALSGGGTRYQNLLSSIDGALSTYLSTAWAERHRGSYVEDFDVVSGLSGIGVYWLQRAHAPAGAAALNTVAELLLGTRESAITPRQWMEPGDAPAPRTRVHNPRGDLNCGLAHGVPGPLAFLAHARSRGIRSKGIDEAIEASVYWLVDHRTDDNWGPNWPTHVLVDDDPGAHSQANTADPSNVTRAAWCYGCPGVARALWRAGIALDRADWRDLAIDAIDAVYRRPAVARQMSSPGLCHGLAGVLQITLRFYHDTRDEGFARQAWALVEELLDLFDPNSEFGFRNPNPNADGDDPSFLEGAAGVAATLLAASTNIAPTWDRVLLIA